MDKFFQLTERGTKFRTEVIAGLTTFITMAYIIFVNPIILGNTGMDKGAVFVATILAASIGTLVMGLFANVPFAQAPGMGLNAFFTFTVVFVMGFSWQQALAIVFICGLINIVITVTSIRKMLIKGIPQSLQYAISGGIGLFIAYIGIKNAHFLKFTTEGYNILGTPVLDDKGGIISITAKDVIPAVVNFTDPVSQLAIIGLVVTIVLMLLKVRGAILIGIIATTIVGIFLGQTTVNFAGVSWLPPSIAPTFFQLDIAGLFKDSSKIFLAITTILAFSLSDTFDTIGTFLGAGRATGIFDAKDEEALEKGKGFSSRLDKALFADATATSIGALLGTSNTTTYIESAAGISAGGKTGLTSVVTAILFLACLFIAPVAGVVPAAATAPALIVVGILMMSSVAKIKWDELEEAVAAFFTMIIMPFTYSIAEGVAFGFFFFVITKIARGKAKEVHPIMYIVTGLFLINFIFAAL
ncbi:MAG: NCS2 family permease [Clostridiales bacterium]|nr:NCS2 family permease [Clostridiales bacterium]